MAAMLVADLVTLLIPVWVLLGIVALFGVLALLARIQNGRFVKPIFGLAAKVPILRKGMERASKAALERSNPELASAMKKMQRTSTWRDPGEGASRAVAAHAGRAPRRARDARGARPRRRARSDESSDAPAPRESAEERAAAVKRQRLRPD